MTKLSIVIYDTNTAQIIATIPNAFEEALDEVILKNGYNAAIIEDDDPRIIDINGVIMFIEDIIM